MTSDTNSSENGFEEFASTALRLQRKGSFEQLLCQHLIVSVSSPLLEKVRLICEAAFMVPKDKLSLDFEQVETVYMATLAFLNTDIRGEFIAVAWGFKHTEENYRRYIEPWHKGVRLSFVAWNTFDVEKKRGKLNRAKSEAEDFFLITNDLNLHPTSFQALKSELLRWSVPVAMEVFEKLSRLVDPDLYREMLQILRSEAKQG